MPEFHKLSVLMPVYNEARTLRTIVQRVLAMPTDLDLELICIDDCSTDASPAILAELAAADDRIVHIRQPANAGKGSAIRAGIERMTGDVAIVQDADLEYDPAEIPRVIQPILEGKADAVFGSRFAASPQRRVLLYWHGVANRMLTWLTNVFNDINLTDMETCYKAVRADVLKSIPLSSRRFGIEPELTTRLAQWDARIYEVPISYHGRSYAEGKKIGVKDAFEAFVTLIRCRFFDRRFTTHDGYYILQSVRGARGFNRWMLSQFKEHIGRRVLEAGCGIGNFTEQLLDRQRLVCVDHDPFYAEMIERRFGHLENVRARQVDLLDARSCGAFRAEEIDTIICLNVLEHIEDDEGVLGHFYDVLEPGGKAIVLVPMHRWLYSECDKTLGHCRRYTADELTDKFRKAGFEVVEDRMFNRLGVLGWMVNKRLGRRDLSPGQMKLYERLLPIAKLIDRIGYGPGLSLIVVGRKSAEAPRASTDESRAQQSAESGVHVEVKGEARRPRAAAGR